MATSQPSNKTLLIPHKSMTQVDQPSYRADMQQIEMWSRQAILELIAGSGITIVFSDNGTTATISSSGGGGGGTPGLCNVFWGPDSSGGAEDSNVFFGSAGVAGIGPLAFNQTDVVMFSNSSGSDTYNPYGTGWSVLPQSANTSVAVLPEFDMPAWTGGTTITVYCQLSAADATFANSLMGVASHSFTTGQSYQFLNTDFAIQYAHGTDLGGGVLAHFFAGSGTSGNGIVSSAGTIAYWAGVSGYIDIPTGTTFT